MVDKPVRVQKYTRRGPVRSPSGLSSKGRVYSGARDDGTALKNLDDARASGEEFEMEVEGQPINRATGKGVITQQLDILLRRELLMSEGMYVVIPEDITIFPANSFIGSFRIYSMNSMVPDPELDTHVASGGVTGSFVGSADVGRLTDIQANITDVEV